MMRDVTGKEPRKHKGERRWPMATAVIACGVMRLPLPDELRLRDARGVFLAVLVVLIGVLMVGDPGRIDRQAGWLRVLTGSLFGLITAVNTGSAVRLVIGILLNESFAQDARVLLASGALIWITNVVAFGLWYWDLDAGGAAARATGRSSDLAFAFPELNDPQRVSAGWYPKFVDYLYLSFNTSLAFSTTDISPVRSWAKLMMMAEQAVSVTIAVFVIADAINALG